MGVSNAIGFALGVLVLIGFIFCTLSREWKRSSPLDSPDHLNNFKSTEGLWLRCTTPDVGEFNCDTFETSIIGLSAIVTAMRALMIISCIIGCAALGLGMMALNCVHAVKGNTKNWMGRAGGGLMVLGSIFCITAVSWYASDTIQAYYYDKNNPSQQIVYEFGAAIYVGWVAGGMGVIAGCLMGCCLNFGEDESARDYGYEYKPPKTKGSPEYV